MAVVDLFARCTQILLTIVERDRSNRPNQGISALFCNIQHDTCERTLSSGRRARLRRTIMLVSQPLRLAEHRGFWAIALSSGRVVGNFVRRLLFFTFTRLHYINRSADDVCRDIDSSHHHIFGHTDCCSNDATTAEERQQKNLREFQNSFVHFLFLWRPNGQVYRAPLVYQPRISKNLD